MNSADEAQLNYWIRNWLDWPWRRQLAVEHWCRLVRRLSSVFDGAQKVLEVGCGPMGMINYVDAEELVGLDPLMDEYAKLFSLSDRIIWISERVFGFREGYFDVVICTTVLEHVKNPGIVLSDIKRVLKKGGRLILSSNTYRGYWYLARKWSHALGIASPAELHCFRDEDIEAMLDGFSIELVESRVVDVDAAVITEHKLGVRAMALRHGWPEALKYLLAHAIGARGYRGDTLWVARRK